MTAEGGLRQTDDGSVSAMEGHEENEVKAASPPPDDDAAVEEDVSKVDMDIKFEAMPQFQ